MPTRKADCHHSRAIWISMPRNAISMSLFYCVCTHARLIWIFVSPKREQIGARQGERALVGAVRQVSQMGTWTRGPNLDIRARAMRTVRLLPQTPSNYIFVLILYITKLVCYYYNYITT